MDEVKKEVARSVAPLHHNRPLTDADTMRAYIKPEEHPHGSFTGYFVAFLIFSTAASYMFMGSKIKNVMKMEMPKVNTNASWSGAATKEGPNPNPNFSQKTAHNEHFNHSSQKTSQHKSAHFHDPFSAGTAHQAYTETYGDVNKVFNLLKNTHLSVLDLTPKDFNEPAIKAAYRAKALKFHPDRVKPNDPRKEEYSKKFQNFTKSYQALLDLLKDAPIRS
jgi:hypothetical protein